jgi:hypothetical protein
LRGLFLCFEAVLGLKINLAISKLVPVGNVINVEVLASILGCRIFSLLMTYLGLVQGASVKAKSIWDDIIKKIKRQLAGWKRLYMSKGRRVLSNLCTCLSFPSQLVCQPHREVVGHFFLISNVYIKKSAKRL